MARDLRGDSEILQNQFITLPNDEGIIKLLRVLNSYYQTQVPLKSDDLTREIIQNQATIYRARIADVLVDKGIVDIGSLSKTLEEEMGSLYNHDAYNAACAMVDEFTKSRPLLETKLQSILNTNS